MRMPIEYDSVSRITAQARGAPGQRTFYIVLSQGNRWVRIWVDRDQLEALGLAIQQIIATLEGKLFLDPEPKPPPSGVDRAGDPDDAPEAEFQAGRIALGYDAERDMLALLVSESDTNDPRDVAFGCRARRDQMQALSVRVHEIIAAGRPRCPLCGRPLDTQAEHHCPRANGHTV